MNIIRQYGDESLFKFTMRTTSSSETVTLPTVAGETYNATINWDGLSTTNCTAAGVGNAYTFANTGNHKISIKGKFGGWSFNNGGDALKLISIDQWGYDNVLFDYLEGGFYGCDNLVDWPTTGSIDGTNSVRLIFNLFRNCGNINKPVYPNIFDKLIKVFGVTSAYQASSITGIPNELFRYQIQINNADSIFTGCVDLVNIGEDVFYYNANIDNLQNCFNGNRNLILPTRMFNLASLPTTCNFTNFMRALSTSYSATGVMQDVWNYATGGLHANAFENQTDMTNYPVIPNPWKGL